MARKVTLTKKGKLLLIALSVIVLGGGAAGTLWYVNQADNQVTSTDSEAGTLCSESDWGCPCGCNASDTACIPADQCGGGDDGPPDGGCNCDGHTACGDSGWNQTDGCTYNCVDQGGFGEWVQDTSIECSGATGDPSDGGNSNTNCGPSGTGGSCPSGQHCCENGQNVGGNGSDAARCKLTCSESSLGDCSQCIGSCGSSGCSISCGSEPLNHQTDCNMWPATYYCRGRSSSGCGDAHGSYLGSAGGTVLVGQSVSLTKNGATVSANTWCSTVQADSNGANGAFSVVYIGDNGEKCHEGSGCDPDALDWDCDNVAPKCDVTATAICASNLLREGTELVVDPPVLPVPGVDTSIDVSWSVTGENFVIGPNSSDGRVNVSISDRANGGSQVDSLSTQSSLFINSGKNPKSALWNFNKGIATDTDYNVKVTVSNPGDGVVCSSPDISIRCDGDKLLCNQSGCVDDSDCTGGLTCTAQGVCRNPKCTNQPTCECPIVVQQSKCNEDCGSDDECIGSLVCSSGKCRAATCTSESSCICDTGSPLLSVSKSSTQQCITGAEQSAQIFYTVVVLNSGDLEGSVTEIVDTLGEGFDPSWIVTDSISNGGELVGNQIIWKLEGEVSEIAPGEDFGLNYSANIPASSFGTYTNSVVIKDATGGEQQADHVVNASCVIPTTGLFDSAQSRIFLAIGLIIGSVFLVSFGSQIEGGVSMLSSGINRTRRHHGSEARNLRSRDASRKKFEDSIK